MSEYETNNVDEIVVGEGTQRLGMGGDPIEERPPS